MLRPGSAACTLAALSILSLPPLLAQQRITTANYAQAEKYSGEFLRQFTYSTSVTPTWIGKTDVFFYRYKTSAGTRYWLVDAEARTRQPLFDHEQLAGALSESLGTAIDALLLDLGNLAADATGKALTFTTAGHKFRYDRESRKLSNEGRAAATPGTPPNANEEQLRESQRQRRDDRQQQEREQQEQEQQEQEQQEQREEGQREVGQREEGQREEGQRERQQQQQARGGRSTAARGRDPVGSFAPDRKTIAFVRDNNLYVMVGTESPPAPSDAQPAEAGGKEGSSDQAAAEAGGSADDKATGTVANGNASNGGADAAPAAPAAPRRPSLRFDEKAAVQLSKDGADDYSFGRGGGPGGRDSSGTTQREGAGASPPGRATMPSSLSWAKDSSAFYATRSDSRGVKELHLVDSIANPRPALQSYRYAMPGEQEVRTTELHVWHRDSNQLVRIAEKWKDEAFRHLHWYGNEVRFVRIDRTLRQVELCACEPKTGEVKVLLAETAKDGPIFPQPPRVLDKRQQFLWWSDRTGWGHFYLYSADGKLLNAVTSGAFRCSRIVDVDEDQGFLWFRANGREAGECIYYEHLYRVRLDGTGLTLLDPGDATHVSTLSPTRRFVVDNGSRVDRAPTAVLRDSEGNLVMPLEQTDLSKLHEIGWQPPEPFVVKAGDGVTDLYGNLWKPFDFDANRRYPIIVNVYPGPQQEGVGYTFAAHSNRQQLAQLGFIVIQVGHRGGAPTRSRQYANHGYHNLRDYGLADKKAAIEQLAMRFPWIDRERVGIFGHSGGGFMTAAALLQPPFNEFFKVGVASAGNHDNNIYNNSWAERYHGLKEVDAAAQRQAAAATGGVATGGRAGGATRQGEGQQRGSGDGARGGSGTATGATNREGRDERFEIRVPTNAELAANLKGRLLLVHGEIDNNVHPANTMRLVDALIKAGKRFDMLIIPGARHSFGAASNYFNHRMWDYFVEHLIGDRPTGADIVEKPKPKME